MTFPSHPKSVLLFFRLKVSRPCAVIPRGSDTAMPMVLEPTSSPRRRPPKGAGVLSVADRLGDGPVADRKWREEFLTFESTPALYAPDHPTPGSSPRRNQGKNSPTDLNRLKTKYLHHDLSAATMPRGDQLSSSCPGTGCFRGNTRVN